MTCLPLIARIDRKVVLPKSDVGLLGLEPDGSCMLFLGLHRSTVFVPHAYQRPFRKLHMESERRQELQTAFEEVKSRVESAREKTNTKKEVKIVAVSKTKHASSILLCHSLGHRIFGENYVTD